LESVILELGRHHPKSCTNSKMQGEEEGRGEERERGGEEPKSEDTIQGRMDWQGQLGS
jgi:hypothetical protein